MGRFLTNLAWKNEKELAPILRPHDEIRLHKTRELEAIEQRRRLDEALGNLTFLEIGFETGLLAGDNLATGRADEVPKLVTE